MPKYEQYVMLVFTLHSPSLMQNNNRVNCLWYSGSYDNCKSNFLGKPIACHGKFISWGAGFSLCLDCYVAVFCSLKEIVTTPFLNLILWKYIINKDFFFFLYVHNFSYPIFPISSVNIKLPGVFFFFFSPDEARWNKTKTQQKRIVKHKTWQDQTKQKHKARQNTKQIRWKNTICGRFWYRHIERFMNINWVYNVQSSYLINIHEPNLHLGTVYELMIVQMCLTCTAF